MQCMTSTSMPLGDLIIQHDTLRDIHRHVAHARQKHGWKAIGPLDRYLVAERELHEFGIAMFKGDKRGARKEALDLIAVLVRVVEGD